MDHTLDLVFLHTRDQQSPTSIGGKEVFMIDGWNQQGVRGALAGRMFGL